MKKKPTAAKLKQISGSKVAEPELLMRAREASKQLEGDRHPRTVSRRGQAANRQGDGNSSGHECMKLLAIALLCALSGCCKCSEERDFEIFQAGALSGTIYLSKIAAKEIPSPTNSTDVLRWNREQFLKLKLP